ncbi:peroxide stress protein YaaA [Desulfogranum japonicum]|uniref:peroxide stress protein YaaA n=1 Tax=Desulfogranum japonicum TaxID=231447 RepID=UPI00040BAC31|nr:peroxide stress protein YaaA [Desulfogranum japonicum]
MLVLSPSKGQNFEDQSCVKKYTHPDFLKQSEELITLLRRFNREQLQDLMDISEDLAALNMKRYQTFQVPFTPENAKQAFCAFSGDVYSDIDVENYTPEDLEFAQKHVRILSGLYGCLRPLDLIQPYRLEMKTRLSNDKGNTLYAFWGTRIAEAMNNWAVESGSKVLFNLASSEYFKVIRNKALQVPVVDILFKDEKAGKLRTIAIYAKRARGKMANYIIQKKVTEPGQLQKFNGYGYIYDKNLSSPQQMVFTRIQP